MPSARAAVLLLAALPRASGSAFLAADGHRLVESADLLSELGRVAGLDHRASVEKRVNFLEDVLRPTFRSLPQAEGQRIPADAVRYLLHRLFVERHGWSVRGLDGRGEAWNSSSAADVFKDHSAGVHGLFSQRLGAGSGGFTLHEVAVLGATLEAFVHEETVDRLRAAYRLAGLAEDDASATDEQVQQVIDKYLVMFVLGVNHTSATPQDMAAREAIIGDVHPMWQETSAWAKQVRAEVLSQSGLPEPPAAFGTTTRVMEEVAERYGRWQDRECRELKSSLMRLERGGSGRVPLDAFYGSALQGNWQFSESRAYLQELGALDDSDPSRPSVIIPNYVNSPSNCVASSKFYSVCCIDECEVLLGHLERQVAAPSAPPARIAELVAQLPSSTVGAPRALPGALVGRLEEIAVHHGGQVPFHGRLFAQWLHHAYPRECPYPHVAGASRPRTAEQWAAEGRGSAEAGEEAMRRHVAEAATAGNATAEAAIPWSMDEELFVHHMEAPSPRVGCYRIGVLAGLVAAASMAVSLLGEASKAVGAATGARGAKDGLKEHLV